MIEKDLSALALQQMISSWKMIFLIIVFILGNLFPSALGAIIGNNRGRVYLALYNMSEEKSLYWIMLGVLFFSALAANLGMQIVKAENAVFKQSVLLLSIPALWVWHLYYGTKEDSFSVYRLLAQVCFFTAIILFLIWDREAVEEEEEYTANGGRKRNDDLEFVDHSIKRLDDDDNNDDELREGLLEKRDTRNSLLINVRASNGSFVSGSINSAMHK